MAQRRLLGLFSCFAFLPLLCCRRRLRQCLLPVYVSVSGAVFTVLGCGAWTSEGRVAAVAWSFYVGLIGLAVDIFLFGGYGVNTSVWTLLKGYVHSLVLMGLPLGGVFTVQC